MDDCLPKLIESFPDVPREQLEEIVRELGNLRGENFIQNSRKFRDRFIQDRKLLASHRTNQLLANKRNSQFIDDNVDRFVANPNDFFRARFQGLDDVGVRGGNDSFAVNRKSIEDRHYGILERTVDKHRHLVDGTEDRRLADAISRLNKGQDIKDFPVDIREVATAVKAVNNSLLETARLFGVSIRERSDYITRQTHNRDKIVAASFEDWKADIVQVLDDEKTFGSRSVSSKEKNDFLKAAYDDIVSGEFENNVGSITAKRVLHFTDSDGFITYNEKYGHGSLLDTVTVAIQGTAKRAAAAKIFGPDGRAAFERLEKQIESMLTPEQRAKFNDTSIGIGSLGSGQKTQRDAWKAEIFGHDRHPGRGILPKLVKWTGLVQSAAKLGLSLPSTLTDIPLSGRAFQAATGKTADFQIFSQFLKNFTNSEELSYWSNMTDLYFGSLQADAYDRYGSFIGGGFSGKSERYLRKAISLTGLPRQSAAIKTANAALFSGHLGRNSNKTWGQLDGRTRAGLERFDISEKDWNIIRQGKETFRTGIDGITPEAIRNIPGLSASKRVNLSTKVQNYLGDMARVGSPEATGLERSLINQGIPADNALGAFLRIAGQFKSFPLAIPRTLRRITLSNPELQGTELIDNFRGQGDLSFLASTMTQATIYAGLGTLARDAIKGRETKMDAAFVADSISRGAMPLMGSYMIDLARGEFSQFGRSFSEELLGPTLGQSQDVIDVLSGAVRLDSDAGVRGTKLIMNNLPGVNLPFARQTLEAVFVNDLLDYFNPGYSNRIEARRLRRELSR